MDHSKAKAMVFRQAQTPFIPYEINLPELQTGEVLVKIKYTTICTSDLHTFTGRRCSHSPSILGHEIIGEVIDLKDGKDFHGHALNIGDRVTWAVYAYDPACKMAKKGIPQKSESLYKYGHEKLVNKQNLSGGFATHCHLKQGSSIFKLPENLSPEEATPLNCTHATIAGALRMTGDITDKNVLIIGAGMLGLSACAMAKEAGAKHVWAMDIDQARLAKARAFGASGVLDANETVESLNQELSPTDGIDVVIETSGVPSAIENAIALGNIGSIHVWVGAVYSQRDLAINAEKIVRNLITLKGLHNYIPEDLAYAIRFLSAAKHKYPFHELVSQDFPLSQLDKAFETANKGGHYRVGIRQS
ncbi:zinc-binding dehydrogenase [Rapidithrix thailandica]|uniref:alcohol dehydrogenase n=1 Tax=Rapidithrix thailandica TaxID=413964 RepID=A0AAW9SBE5_9BACT